MAVNPTEWLLSTLDACCKKYFNGFLYDACIGRYAPDHDDCITVTALFYPDWNGSNEGCIDEGKEPYYMLSNANYFLSNSIEECCEKFYEWNYFSCTGMKPELTNGEYYPDWTGSSTATCLNDDKMPTYMLNNQGWYLSTSLEKCCERHFLWGLKECLGTSDVGSNDWYVKYEDETCVQDCNGASPCGGIADSWVELFKSKEKCCEDTLPWKPRCRFY
jgi:hypothetical protein